jgi:hypothetical protein
MKKTVLLALALIGLVSIISAKAKKDEKADCRCHEEFKIIMNGDGQIEQVIWNTMTVYLAQNDSSNGNIFVDPFNVRLPGQMAFPKALSVGTEVKITLKNVKGQNAKFVITAIPKKTKYDVVPIFTGKTELTERVAELEEYKCSFFLDESGTTYEIKVTRSTTDKASDKPDEQAPKVIFDECLRTRARYYLGSCVGISFPLRKSARYSLGYVNATSGDATIVENYSLNVRMVFLGSIYPFGFEPEDGTLSYRRIQLNIGTEISSSIFKQIYFGPGYDFTYCSIGVLFRYGETQELQSGFNVGELITNGIAYQEPVPLVSKNKFGWGLTLCLPVDFLFSWLGKAVGAK